MAEIITQELEEVIAVYRASFVQKCLALALSVLVILEHVETLKEEAIHFWNGPWTASRILFLANRYLVLLSVAGTLIASFTPGIPQRPCGAIIQTTMAVEVVNLFIIQLIVVLRIWYLYPGQLFARGFVILSFLACSVATLVSVIQLLPQLAAPSPLPPLHGIGCSPPTTHSFWHIFLPTLIQHTVLYGFTAYRSFHGRQASPRESVLLLRLLYDNGLFYLVVIGTATFTLIGAWRTDIRSLNIPALYSSCLCLITSVCISRVMLNLRSLARTMVKNPNWLLNEAEFGRIMNWRPGALAGEVIVEMSDYGPAPTGDSRPATMDFVNIAPLL